MKVTVAGAGAIGGLVAARIAASNIAQVSVLARGKTLAALREHGLRLQMGGERIAAPVTACEDAGALGVQDLLMISVKGPSLPTLAPKLKPLIGPETCILPMMNGVPWWFCQVDGPFSPFPLQSVDPDGQIAASLPSAQTLGCVVHIAATSPEPGLSHHAMNRELVIGDAVGGISRSEKIARLLTQAGLEVRLSGDIRHDIWYKLWGNLTMNPVSALTGATVDRLLDDPLVRNFCSAAMREAAAVGEGIGCHVAQQPDDRHAITRRIGAFKTSMLQDVEAGRAIELDSIVGAAQEIARHLGMETPFIDAILGLTRLMAQTRRLYPAGCVARHGADRPC